jgi:hypothetical protein
MSAPQFMLESVQVADTHALIGKYPNCGPMMVKYGTESKLPCKSGIDNSTAFSTLPYAERMANMLRCKRNAPAVTPRQPARKRVNGRFVSKSEALVSDILGFDTPAHHLHAFESGKAAAKMYKGDVPRSKWSAK